MNHEICIAATQLLFNNYYILSGFIGLSEHQRHFLSSKGTMEAEQAVLDAAVSKTKIIFIIRYCCGVPILSWENFHGLYENIYFLWPCGQFISRCLKIPGALSEITIH